MCKELKSCCYGVDQFFAMHYRLLVLLWCALKHTGFTRFFLKQAQSLIIVVDMHVVLKIGGFFFFFLHLILSLMDGWLLLERQGMKASLPEGIPSPLSTWGSNGKQTLGCRLMTACRQAGFGSGGALFTTINPLCLAGVQLFHRCKNVDMKFLIHNRHWLI